MEHHETNNFHVLLNQRITLIYSLSVFALFSYAALFPTLFYGSWKAFFEENRYAFLWSFITVGFLYFIYFSILLVSRLVFFERIALYKEGEHIIFLYPFFVRFKTTEINLVKLQHKHFIANNITVELSNGKKLSIWATFLDQNPDDLLRILRDFIV